MSLKKKLKSIYPSLLLIITNIFYYVPGVIYFANRSRFDNYFYDLIISVIAIIGLIGLIIGFVISLIPYSILKYLSSLLIVISLLLWFNSDIFVVSYGVLDGSDLDFTPYDQRGIVEVIILGISIIIALLFYKFINKNLPFIVVLIALGQIVLTTISMISEPQDKTNHQANDEFNSYSTKKNIILIILDTFGSDYFVKARNQNPEVIDVFSGFINYTDAISNYPATKASLPSLLTGKMISDDIDFHSYTRSELKTNGLPVVLNNKGYRSSVISNSRKFHYTYSTRFTTNPKIDSNKIKKLDAFRLLDYSIFRVVPHFYKDTIYNKGFWILSDSIAKQQKVPNTLAEKGLYLLNNIISNAQVTDEIPRFKIIHALLPHPKFIFDKDCNKHTLNNELSEMMLQQSMCALKKVEELLEKFKQLGIYDSSLIAIIADHGSRVREDKSLHGLPSYHELATSGILFMVKGVNQHNELIDVDSPVSLLSLYPLFIDDNLHNKKMDFLIDDDRKFYSYKNRNNTKNGFLPDAPLFKVKKNWSDPKNWILDKFIIHKCQTQSIPINIDLSNNDREKYCVKFGFAKTDKSGAWTESDDIRMFLKLDLSKKDAGSFLSFKTSYIPFIEHAQKTLSSEWYINDILIKTESHTTNKNTSTVIKIPMELAKSKEVIELKIKLSKLKSYKDMGINNDTRKLGLFINNVDIY